MKQFRTLFLLSVAFSLIYLASGPGPSERMAGFKVGSILLLALAGFRVDKLLGTALAMCSVGDLLLGVRRLGSLDAEKVFLPGLGAFLAAHLIYIAMFRRYKGVDGWKPGLLRIVGIAVIPILLGLVLGVLRHSLGSLLIPVAAYGLVLAVMAISAMLADLGNPLTAIGVLFFVTSDALLAIRNFHGQFQAGSPRTWITYYLAQVLIVLGIERWRGRIFCPPANTMSGIEQAESIRPNLLTIAALGRPSANRSAAGFC